MTEKNPAKIIDFSARRASKVETAPVRTGDPVSNITDIHRLPNKSKDKPLITIPSLQDMYNLDLITTGEFTIEEILDGIRALKSEEDAEKGEYRVELQLLKAREQLISESFSDVMLKILPYNDLFLYTLGRAEELSAFQTADYKGMLRGDVISDSRIVLGDKETWRIIDKHQLIEDANNAGRSLYDQMSPKPIKPPFGRNK